MITIVNYGVGNLHSVKKAFEIFDRNVIVSEKIEDILKADKIVLPGVGHLKGAMSKIISAGIFEPLIFAGKNKPVFGICLGMQLLFEESEEGDIKGLSLIKGHVIKFPNNLKVPHVGWNTVHFSMTFSGIPQDSWFYFVHSYYPIPEEDVIIGITDYGGIKFASCILKDNIIGCQFHPEKSGKIGLKFIENFVKL